MVKFFQFNILAIVLPSLRISPLLILVKAIIILYAAALSFNVVYIQSIGSGIGTNSELLFSSSGLIELAALQPVLAQPVSSKSKEECSTTVSLSKPSSFQEPFRREGSLKAILKQTFLLSGAFQEPFRREGSLKAQTMAFD
jgi:hypothetical protein